MVEDDSLLDIAPYSLFDADRRFITLLVEAVCISETSIYINEATWRYVPEGFYVYIGRHENLKSHFVEKRIPLSNAYDFVRSLQGAHT
jgi:hypothetical protein